MSKYNIYTIDDLINKDYDDEEIELVSKSLQYSLVIAMFNFVKINKSQKEIIELCKQDGWFDKYEWTENQMHIFKNKLEKMFYNLYRFGPIKCENSAQEWIMKYGFKLKTLIRQNKKNQKINKSKIYKNKPDN